MLRHEIKYFISSVDSQILEEILRQYMYTDPNDDGSGYLINSIYFDTPYDDDLQEKVDGILYREKYRIRYYNENKSYLKFEVKRKENNYIEKISEAINDAQFVRFMSSDFLNINFSSPDLEYVPLRMKSRLYRPIVNVGYQRRAYYLPYNNIRVTIDRALKAAKVRSDGQLENYAESASILSDFDILEVKYNNEFPCFLTKIISEFKCVRSSASKYAHSRIVNFDHPYQDGLFIPF